MTEEEAKTKLCPMVRFDDCCIASCCMMWRWKTRDSGTAFEAEYAAQRKNWARVLRPRRETMTRPDAMTNTRSLQSVMSLIAGDRNISEEFREILKPLTEEEDTDGTEHDQN